MGGGQGGSEILLADVYSEGDPTNAFNHPPGCDCGWGGVWYGNSPYTDGWLFDNIRRGRSLGAQPGTRFPIAGGYTNPNAQCPVCGAAVYFYMSPYGGRVYFDDLGPPWPKHPCTDTLRTTTPRSNTLHTVQYQPTSKSWRDSNWHPLTNAHIERYGKEDRMYAISGRGGTSNVEFLFQSESDITADVIRYKRTRPGHFRVSLIYFDPDSDSWYHAEFPVFTDAKDARTHGPTVSIRFLGNQHLLPPPKEDIETTEQSSSATHALDSCLHCKALVARRNMKRHLRKVHGIM